MTIRFARLVRLAALLGPIAAAGDARAAGFATAKFGGELGTPMTQDPTAIYYNPAGIALSNGVNIFADGNIAFRGQSYDREPNPNAPGEIAEPADAKGANTGHSSLFNVLAAPFLGATAAARVSDAVGVAGGLALFVPFGGQAIWSQNSAFAGNTKYPGPLDGTQRYAIIQGSARSIYVSAAFALSIKDIISLGLSGGVSLDSLDSLRAKDGPGDTDLSNEGRAWFKGSAVGAQLGGGLMVTPLRDKNKLRLALSYQAPPELGRMALKGTLNTSLGGGVNASDMDLYQTLPDIVRFGVSFRPIDVLELRAFGDYERWSLFSDQCFNSPGQPCDVNPNGSVSAASSNSPQNLPRRWHDTGSAHLGLSYWVRPPIELFAGVGFDMSAVPDQTLDPALVDFNNVSAGLGVRGQFDKHWAGAIGYTHYFFFSREIHLDPRTVDQGGDHFLPPSNSPDMSGVYKQTIGVINVNLMASFDPFVKPAK